MFVDLYEDRELNKLKRNIFLAGAFLVAGGIVALMRELPIAGAGNIEWVYAAAILVVAGIVCIAFAVNIFPLKKTYFSMDQAQLSYRLTFFSREYILPWSQLSAVKTTDEKVIFVLRDESEINMALTVIPDDKVANHIKRSITLAAMERNLEVNGNLMYGHKVAL